jgi:hypothetical protein
MPTPQPLNIKGVSRGVPGDQSKTNCLTLIFDRGVSDDEMRAVHEHLRQLPRSIALGVDAGRALAMEATGADVNRILQMLARVTDNGDRQLTTLAVAFVTACLSCQVSPHIALGVVQKIFEEPPELVPLEMGEN